MKVSELVAKLLEVDQDLDVGYDDREWGFETIAACEVKSMRILEEYEVVHDSGEKFPGFRRTEEPVTVVALS